VARGLAWGDIRLVEFSRPDKTRPALVLTRTSAIKVLSGVTVAPITRTIRGIPTELRLGTEHGLKAESVANLDSVQTVRKEHIGRYVGAIGAEHKPALREALLFALELEEEAS
jgi:mRNA interferase MazF